MAYTYEQALALIGTEGYTGLDGLRKLVNETSVIATKAAPDAQILFYASEINVNPTNPGYWSKTFNIAKEIVKQATDANGLQHIVMLENTPVADLLIDKNFQKAVFEAAGNDENVFNLFVNGIDSSGNRVTNISLWDDASRMLAETAKGDIKFLSPNGILNSVFVQTELPTLLQNSNVTHIDGIPVNQLVAIQNKIGIEGLSHFLFDSSLIKTQLNSIRCANFN